MRIMFWCDWFRPYIGGVEVIAERLLVELAERGHEIVVVTSLGERDLPEEETYGGLEIHRLPFYRAITAGDPRLLLQTRRRATELKRRIAPDLVHLAIIAPSAFFHLQTRDAHPCPTLVTRQDLLTGPSTSSDTIFGNVVRNADWIACCSQAMRDETVALVPEVAERCSVVLNGMDPPAVAPAPLPPEPRLAWLGRVVPEKALDVAVRAMKPILAARPDARLAVAGDGPERDGAEALARELGVAGAIDLRGWIEPADVPDFINEASLVLMPSRVEAFGLVALEAAFMGRPVVASAVGGLREVVEDGRTGRLVPPDDPEALAHAALGLLEDRDAAEACGRAARERAQQLFSWDRYRDGYEALYRHLVAGVPVASTEGDDDGGPL